MSEKWHVQPNAYFLDKDTDKGRELDIKASFDEFDSSGSWTFLVDLLIQCKKLPGHAWIFFSNPSPPHRRILRYCLNDFLEFGYYSIYDIKGTCYGKNAVLATNFCEIIMDSKKSNKKDDNIWECVITLIKATSQELNDAKTDTKQYLEDWTSFDEFVEDPFELVQIFYPLIIFEGQLYEASFDGNDISLEPKDHIQLSVDYISGRYKGLFCIDVITKQRLPKYLEDISNDIRIFDKRKAEKSKQYQQDMLDAVKSYLTKHTDISVEL